MALVNFANVLEDSRWCCISSQSLSKGSTLNFFSDFSPSKWIESNWNLKDKEDQMLSRRRNLLIAITFFSRRKCHISLMKLGWWVYQSSRVATQLSIDDTEMKENIIESCWENHQRYWRTMENAWKKVRQNCSILVDSNDWKWIFRIVSDWLDFISDHHHQLHLHLHACHLDNTPETAQRQHRSLVGSSSKPSSSQSICTLQLMWFITIALSVNCSHHHHPLNFFFSELHALGRSCVRDVATYVWICFENCFQFNKLLKSMAGIKSRSEVKSRRNELHIRPYIVAKQEALKQCSRVSDVKNYESMLFLKSIKSARTDIAFEFYFYGHCSRAFHAHLSSFFCTFALCRFFLSSSSEERPIKFPMTICIRHRQQFLECGT